VLPIAIQVRKNTSAAAIKTRDWTIAIASCEAVLKIDPACTKSLYRRALANWHLGEVEKASADLETILKQQVTDYAMIQESSQVGVTAPLPVSYATHSPL
jgi:regulator of sirC expression with transglutaminase-like and TPR domain